MALNIGITLNSGVTANYHKITKLNLDISEREVSVVDENNKTSTTIETVRLLTAHVSGYASQEIRESGINNYLTKDRYCFYITEKESEENLRTVAYDYLKTLDKYEDAIDC